MAVPEGHRNNFETLKRAFQAGDVALVECVSATTGEPAYVICMTNRDDEGSVTFVPVAKMFDENPYDEWLLQLEDDAVVGASDDLAD
jgi:hypothetical protein